MTDREAMREFLRQQIEAARARYDGACARLREAFASAELAADDADTFEAALEAYARETDSPYARAPRPNPADVLFPRKTKPARRVERVTKQSLLLALLEANPEGMRPREIAAAWPADAPFTMTADDASRALNKLKNMDKVRRGPEGWQLMNGSSPRPSSAVGAAEEGAR